MKMTIQTCIKTLIAVLCTIAIVLGNTVDNNPQRALLHTQLQKYTYTNGCTASKLCSFRMISAAVKLLWMICIALLTYSVVHEPGMERKVVPHQFLQ